MNKKTLLAPLFAIALGGCLDTGNMLKSAPGVGEYYTFDTELMRLCQGQSRQCLELTVIVSDRLALDDVERAYGSPIKGPNYPLRLAETLLNPPQGQYEAQPQDENGRYYRLPVNPQTDAVWEALTHAFDSIYNS